MTAVDPTPRIRPIPPKADAGEEFIIDLNDFTPGIYSDYTSPSDGESSAPDCAAQLSGTVGCIGSPNGGLIPGPRIVAAYLEALFDGTGNFPTNETRMAVCAFRNLSPVQYQSITDTTTGGGDKSLGDHQVSYPDFLFVGFQSFVDVAAGTSYKQASRIIGYKFASTPVQSAVVLAGEDFDNSTGIGIVAPYLYGWMSVELGRTTTPGLAASLGATSFGVACLYSGARTAVGQEGSFPHFNNSYYNFADSVSRTVFTPLGTYVSRYCTHQGRLLAVRNNVSTQAIGADLIVSGSDLLAGTDPVDWQTAGFGTADPRTTFVEENPSGIGLFASMNASELIVIKTQGGGFVARGDLENPTIVRLPGLPSVGQASNIPVNTSFGLVYGTMEGVWVYTGGDTATLISPQLDGWFWKPHTISDQVAGPKGSFGYRYPYLFAPNNFIMDERTGAWWRFGNPSRRVYAWYTPSANGNILCGPPFISAVAANTSLCDWFDINQGTYTYSWKSHPLRRTRNRTTDVHEILVTFQLGEGSTGVGGTVTITLSGHLDGSTTRTETVTSTAAVDVAHPRTIRVKTEFQAQDIVVTITSTAGSTSYPAPRVDRVALLCRSQIEVART